MTRLIPICFAVAVALLASSPDAWAKTHGPATSRPAESAPASSTEPVSRSTAEEPSLDQSYRAREAKAGTLENFKGGDTVIISSTTVIVVLLVVLILVLI